MDRRQLHRKKPRAYRSYVYFIQAQQGGPVKIGWTVNPERRLKGLQVAYPYELVIRYVVNGTQRLEHYLHERFNSCRLRGEWFEAHPDMPGCLHDGGISTADWLNDPGKIKAFEVEAEQQRKDRREYQQKKKQEENKKKYKNKVFEQTVKDLLKPK